MSENVVKFPHAALSPPPAGHAPPCATCAYFHPNTDRWGTKWGGWFKPRKPTADAYGFGICSYFGGGYASLERGSRCYGECHSPASLQPT